MTGTGEQAADVVISAASLLAELAAGTDVVLLDVRRDDSAAEARAFYQAGHLPGAYFVTVTAQLAGPRSALSGTDPAGGQRYPGGRPPLGHQSRLAGRRVLGRVPGYRHARVVGAALGRSSRCPLPRRRRRCLGGRGRQRQHRRAGRGQRDLYRDDRVAAYPGRGRRGRARPGPGCCWTPAGRSAYAGGEPGTGHIPGALSAPGTANVNADGLLKTREELQAHYAALGADGRPEVGVYCGGGVAATLDILALTRLGVPAALYPGILVGMELRPARPAATGDQPG